MGCNETFEPFEVHGAYPGSAEAIELVALSPEQVGLCCAQSSPY